MSFCSCAASASRQATNAGLIATSSSLSEPCASGVKPELVIASETVNYFNLAPDASFDPLPSLLFNGCDIVLTRLNYIREFVLSIHHTTLFAE